MSLTQTWSQSPTNELVAIHHLKRFCYTAHVFTSWSAVKENGLLFCAAKVCVSESPAQVGTHSFSDMERFTRIRKMSNNVKLSLQTTIRRRRKKKITSDYKIHQILIFCGTQSNMILRYIQHVYTVHLDAMKRCKSGTKSEYCYGHTIYINSLLHISIMLLCASPALYVRGKYTFYSPTFIWLVLSLNEDFSYKVVGVLNTHDCYITV